MARNHDDELVHADDGDLCKVCLLEHFKEERAKLWWQMPLFTAIPFIIALWVSSWNTKYLSWVIGAWLLFTLLLLAICVGELTRRINMLRRGEAEGDWFSFGPGGKRYLK